MYVMCPEIVLNHRAQVTIQKKVKKQNFEQIKPINFYNEDSAYIEHNQLTANIIEFDCRAESNERNRGYVT